MFILIPFLGAICLIAGIVIMTIASDPKKREAQAFPLHIVALTLFIVGFFLAISPKWIIYPYWPYDKSVASVEDGKVVYHPYGFWRESSYTVPSR